MIMILHNILGWRRVVIWSTVVGLLCGGAVSARAQDLSTRIASSNKAAAAVAANHNRRDGRSHVSLLDGTSLEADDVWEDEQGVRYRRGGVTYLVERARVRSIERGTPVDQSEAASETQAAKNEKQVARLVEVSANGIERTT